MALWDSIKGFATQGKDTPWGAGGASGMWERIKSGDKSLMTSDIPSLLFTGTPYSANLGAGAAAEAAGVYDPTPAPTYEPYKKFDPNEYQGFDNSKIAQSMQRDVASGAAQRRQQQLAQLNKMGVRGADSTAAMGRTSADTERTMQAIQANLARQSYEDAWRQYMAGAGDWNKQQDRALQAWQAQEQSKADEKSSRGANLGNVLGAVGMYYGAKGKK